MFPSFEPPAKNAFSEFLKSQEALRDAMWDCPIRCPCVLPIVRVCSDPNPPEGFTPEVLHPPPSFPPEFRPVARPRRLPSLLDPKFMEVTLTEELQLGACQAQVYRGRLCVASETQPKIEADVVVKLFHECMFPGPSYWRVFDPDSPCYRDWQPATELAQTEAWAYERLEDIQGIIVPHYYGSYMFTMPSGEEVIGAIVEYIHGWDLKAYAEHIGKTPANQWKLGDAAAWSLLAIHARGVIHGSVVPGNVRLIKNDSPESISLVFFDFAQAMQPLSERGFEYYDYDGEGILLLMEYIGCSCALRDGWAATREHEGGPWAQIFYSRGNPTNSWEMWQENPSMCERP